MRRLFPWLVLLLVIAAIVVLALTDPRWSAKVVWSCSPGL
jgi:hypothetical protein